jgi:hypothetical protein
MGYIIWGKVYGSDVLIKLHYEPKRNMAVNWMKNNLKYYNDMRVYKSNLK